jgi:MscS family membrane protein
MEELIISLKISDSKIINSLINFGIFLFVAIILRLFITKILTRLTRLTKSDVDDTIIDALKNPIFYTFVIAGLKSSLGHFKIPESYDTNIHNTLNTFIVIFWMVAAIRVIKSVATRGIKKVFDMTGLSKDIIPLIATFIRIAVFVAALMAIFSIWSIDITPLIASAGIASAVIAFAAKDTIANFFGGISVFLDKPYKIGDYIELDSKERGEVVEIGVRSTRIKTRDDILISIPNSIIANSKIVNESAPVENFRVRVPIGVAYGSDIELVEKTLLEITKENENLLDDPEPRVRFRSFGDSALNFELLSWAIEPSLRGKTIHDLNKAIYHRFAELGIQIPFPQRDLHIIKPENKDDGDNAKKEEAI